VSFDVVNKLMTKKEISNMIDAVYRNCGQKETVIFCDRIMRWASPTPSRPASRSARTTWSCRRTSGKIVDETRALTKEYEQQYQ
jgi:DNA-directed RNA polymerase subunit beta'